MKLDRRRKYYLVLDTETATLSFARKYNEEQRKKIAIAKPLVYDLGWQIIDRQGRVYDKKNFLITETFSVPEIFNTAYYKEKRPLYIDKLEKGEIVLTDWKTAVGYLEEALSVCEAVGAYNSMFDFKKAIPFTELYINYLYSAEFHEWLEYQDKCCDYITTHRPRAKENSDFEPDVFRFHGKSYPLFDIWGLACEHLLNNDDYKKMCVDNEWFTASGKYYKTSAETAYRFLKRDSEFIEAHTALDDAIIESELLSAIIKKKKNNFSIGLIYFPFKILGEVEG